MTAQSNSSETATNGSRKHSAEMPSTKHASAAAASPRDIQEDLQALQQDIAQLSQQLAGLVATKGSEAWKLAKDNFDGVLADAGDKGKDAADAVEEMRDNMVTAIGESIENRPYTTLALTLAAGFVVGAMWKR